MRCYFKGPKMHAVFTEIKAFTGPLVSCMHLYKRFFNDLFDINHLCTCKWSRDLLLDVSRLISHT
jgi:hypothetical protein